MPKKFISFLGTTNYVRCNYIVPDSVPQRATKGVRFVQEAIIDLHCSEWTSEDDRFLIFVTKEAKAKNWKDSCHTYKDKDGKIVIAKDEENIEGGKVLEGLETRLKRLGILDRTQLIDIPGGFSQEEVWQIFNKVFKQIEPKDQLLLDITNAFRFIPMLGMVLINYAKVVKESSVLGIYYGAFEKLGPAWKVRNMNPEDKNASIVDITSLAYLQDWTIAASDFVQFGNAQRISKLTQENVKDLQRISKGKNVVARQMNGFANHLLSMTQSISTVRGKAIIEGKIFDRVTDSINDFEKSDFIVPLFPLLEKIKDKAVVFEPKQTLNGFKAVEWCCDNELIQQGITLLQEMVVTYVCNYFEDLDYLNKDHRDLVNQCFTITNKKLPEKKWAVKPTYKTLAKSLLKQPIFKHFKKVFAQLTDLRNDINHGGFTSTKNPNNFRKKLEKYLDTTQELLESVPPLIQIEEEPILAQKLPNPLFINLSNHPSGLWKNHQKEAATKEWGEIIDLPFPNIPPDWTDKKVKVHVEKYLQKCLDLATAKKGSIAAIHLMGEMTFTFLLVQLLKKRGITVLASTTERLTSQDENGNKVTHFNFIQFREY